MIPIGIIELVLFASSIVALFVVPNALAENIDMHIDPSPTYCQRDIYCNISSTNTISIENTSNEARTYHVVHAIYTNDKKPTKLEFNVPINSHSKWQGPRVINHHKQYSTAGKFIVNYFATITGPGVNQQIQIDKYVEVNNWKGCIK